MSLDGSTLPPSSQQWLPKTSLLSPNARQGSSVEGTQDAIISHSPGSYSTHRPTHFQVEEVPPPGKRPFGWTTRYRGTTAACSTGGKVGDISGRAHPHTQQLPCWRHLPDEAKDVTHAPSCHRLGTAMLHLPRESRASQPQGISENHFQRDKGRTQEAQPDGRGNPGALPRGRLHLHHQVGVLYSRRALR